MYPFNFVQMIWKRNITDEILYSYFMPVCSIVKSITRMCRGRPDALLHEAVVLLSNPFDEILSSVSCMELL